MTDHDPPMTRERLRNRCWLSDSMMAEVDAYIESRLSEARAEIDRLQFEIARLNVELAGARKDAEDAYDH